MVGRPTKYTPEAVKKITDAISMGATYELAAGYAGISYDTLNDWRQKKPQFSEAIKEAEGRAAVGWLAKIEKAANDGQWTAAAWKLERRYPNDYGRTVVDHGNKNDEPFSVEVKARDYRAGLTPFLPPDDATDDGA
jgi:hypothetical protein